jgi:hypothetical protein
LVGSLAPLVVVAVHPHLCKTRLVADGLQNACWIQDISDSLVPLAQYVTLWSKMQDVQLNGEPDKFVWKWHQTSNTRPPVPTGHSSMVSAVLQGPRNFPSYGLLLAANFSSGLLSLGGPGRRKDCSDTIYRTMASVPYVPKLRKPSNTCCSIDLIVGRSGSEL